MTLTQIKPAGLSKPVDLADNERIRLGTGNDLEIYHSGSHSYIQDNGTGALYIGSGGGGIYIRGQHGEDSIIANSNGSVELYYDNVKKLETGADRITVTGHVMIQDGNLYIKNGFNDANSRIRNTGGSNDANLEFLVRASGNETEALEITNTSHIRIPNDNKQLRFGAGDDLVIYHSGSHSYITNNGEGHLYIKDTGIVKIVSDSFKVDNGDETKQVIKCNPDAGIELYYNAAKKFETVGDGVHMTRELRIVGTNVNEFESGRVRLTEDGHGMMGGYVHYDGSANILKLGVHPSNDTTVGNDVDSIEMNRASGQENVQLNYSGGIRFETTSSGVKIPDSRQLTFGDGNDFRLEHDGTNSYITNYTGILNFRTVSNETSAKFIPNQAVELYYNNSKKIETTSTGISVTGKATFPDGNTNGITIGDSGDLRIFHNGSHSYVENVTGNLNLTSTAAVVIKTNNTEDAIVCNPNDSVDLYHNGNRQVFTIDGGMNWQDNKKAEFGNSGDLKIYHDGSNSYIQDTGTGDMRLTGSTIRLKSSSTTEDMLVCHENNRVDLFYNNVKTARTIKTGNTNGFLAGSDSYINDSIDHGEFIVRKDLASPAQPSITQCARATIITNERTAGVNGYGGALFFGGQDVDTNDQYTVDLAAIGATTNGNDIGNSSASGFLDFYTRNGGTFGHKFRIEQDGDLLGTDTSIGSLSDSRLKENIEDFTFDINKFKQFQPKLFNWKHPEYHRDTPASGKHRGFIAQDLEVIDSELVTTYRIPKENPESALVDQVTLETEEYKEVVAEGKTSNLGRIDAMYISVINQLIAKVEALETKVAVLEAK